MKKRKNVRRIYEKYYNIKLPKNIEVHHVVPVHDGGTDNIDNLIAITKETHAKLHLDRYNKLGDYRDLCSYHMIGYNFTEAHKISCSEGGKIGGKKVKDNNLGIFRSEEDRKVWASMGGKASIISPSNPWSYWASEEGRTIRASMGGKKGAFTNSSIQSELGRRGGLAKKGAKWYNDGEKCYTYTKAKSIKFGMDFDTFLSTNPQYKAGRLKSKGNNKCQKKK